MPSKSPRTSRRGQPTQSKQSPHASADRCPERTSGLPQQLSELQAKLEEIVELLHLWKNEACTYRLLAEAMVTGRYSLEGAKRALAKGVFGPEELRLIFLPLNEAEHRAFNAIAAFSQLAPQEFLWACADTVMGSCGDQDVLLGCAEAARKRFRDGRAPDWAREERGSASGS